MGARDDMSVYRIEQDRQTKNWAVLRPDGDALIWFMEEFKAQRICDELNAAFRAGLAEGVQVGKRDS